MFCKVTVTLKLKIATHHGCHKAHQELLIPQDVKLPSPAKSAMTCQCSLKSYHLTQVRGQKVTVFFLSARTRCSLWKLRPLLNILYISYKTKSVPELIKIKSAYHTDINH